jgi:hypothetical protein
LWYNFDMKSKTLHVVSFTAGLLVAIIIFAFIYINPSSESVLLDSTWSILFTMIFILGLILSGYFIFRNSVRTALSGTGALLLLISYLSFAALIIYIFMSIADGFVGLLVASVFAPVMGIIIAGLYLIGVVTEAIAFLKRNNIQKIREYR